MAFLLGLDSGLTVTKAVLFDETGAEIAVARCRVPQLIPRPRHVERDMDALWSATAGVIAQVIGDSGLRAADIAAVAATAHGDGLYLLDAAQRPLGNAILSLDSRAEGLIADWGTGDLFDAVLDLTGQVPHASAPAALLAWIKRNEPGRFARIAHVLACKDWLRFCLTGTVGTDRTEASASFTNVATQHYAPEALRLYGLDPLAPALPEVTAPAGIAGQVTAEAAARTGLVAGTPVAAGLHDVTASALGIGGQRSGTADIVAGTYSINQIVTDAPRTDRRWFCRNGIQPGTWNAMSISPASSANYDWFVQTLCRDGDAASVHAALARDVRAALDRPSTLLFHPYLFGSPQGGDASGGFFGLRGWHDRGDMLRAVFEGIAFNHRHHIDALHESFAFDRLRLTGGVSRNPDFAQMLADVTSLGLSTSTTGEAAAWGAALCAGAAVGLYATPFDDPRDLGALERSHAPDPARQAAYQTRYDTYRALIAAMTPLWPRLEALGQSEEPA